MPVHIHLCCRCWPPCSALSFLHHLALRARRIQDTLKVLGYRFLHKFNVFNVNTDRITNVRAATSPNDPHVPMARMSVGLVENKLLAAKVESAIQAVEDVARKSHDPAGLNRVSKSLALMRTSVQMARQSVGAKPGTSDVEAQRHNLDTLKEQVKGLEQALAAAPENARPEIQVQLDSVKATAEKLAKVDEAARTGHNTGVNN